MTTSRVYNQLSYTDVRLLVSLSYLNAPIISPPQPSALNGLRTNVHTIMQLDNVNFKTEIWKHFQISVKSDKKKGGGTFQTKIYLRCYPRSESKIFGSCRVDKCLRKDLSNVWEALFVSNVSFLHV